MPDCPTTPLQEVDFTTTATTIMITAPGISAATCKPAPTVLNSAASIQVTPNALSFGGQKVGTPSAAQKVTITSTGTQAVNLVAFAVVGDYDQDNDCPESLDQGAKCTVDVTFTPKAKGARGGNLQIISDAVTPKVKVTLSGVGQ
jgi:hypothetical protein